MRMKKYCPVLFFLLLSVLALSAQEPGNNMRVKRILSDTAWQMLDSLSIVPGSFIASETGNKRILENSEYKLSNNKVLFFKKGVSLEVQYRVLPFDLGKPYFKIDTQYLQQTIDRILIPYNPYAGENRMPDFGSLQYNGTFARGISFGNSQNLVLNSNLNLQMTGRLTNDIEVLASVSDNSIPLQPEGNTAQLQEFDKVYIQLKRKNSSLTAGDYELSKPDNYFINYFKKLQGATFSNQATLNENSRLDTRASIAIARGKFARNILTPGEGNQGPYRLNGAEGEQFIVILSGTERVFIDGELMQRGLQADYIIDYNTASITFTANRLVTKDSRIIVEFDYTDLSYLRSLVALDVDYHVGNTRVYYHLYSDQDGKNSFADGTLSNADKLALSMARDNDMGALVPGIDRQESFNALRVTYRLIDTVICGQPDSILVYSTNPDLAIYTARFTEVGFGNGNYVLSQAQSANGRVYEWVPPVNCIPQGNFSPVIRLAAPRQQQMMSLGTETPLLKGLFTTEFSLSKLDENLFSDLDSGDDYGWAGRTTFERSFVLDTTKGWTLETDVQYEYIQEDFTFISPFRPQEFARDWNLSQTVNGQLGNSDLDRANEQWLTGNLFLQKKKEFGLSYNYGGFWREEGYRGNRHGGSFFYRKNGWNNKASGSVLSSTSSFENTLFYKPSLFLEKTFLKKDSTSKKWTLQSGYNREWNLRTVGSTDSLRQTSFGFDRVDFGLIREVNENLSARLQASRRWDYLPVDVEVMSNTSIADEIKFNGNWRQNKSSRLEWNLSYRKLSVFTPSQIAPVSGETYLGRINYDFTAWKGILKSSTSYELGTGQEPRIEYNFLRVNDGEGVYQWNDYNDDGVAQQNEFEIAVFQDSASFVRVANLSPDFIKTNNAVFNQSLLLEPRSVWFREEGWKKLFSKFSLQSISQIVRKVKDAEGVSQWNPFQLNIIDTALVATSVNSRNVLFFNRADPKYDLQLGYTVNQNRLVITTGYEERQIENWELSGRWNFVRGWSFKTNMNRERNRNTAENFSNRNYAFEKWQVEPSLNWQPGARFRTVLLYSWENSYTFDAPDPTASFSQSLGLEANVNITSGTSGKATSFRSRFTFAEVQFDGNANSPLGFAMLSGLRNGQNFLWELSFDRQLVKNIRLNLSYSGRKTGVGRVVHLGRAQVAAVF